MASDFSAALRHTKIVAAIQPLIMQRIHAAFAQVSDASDQMTVLRENANASFGYNLYFVIQGTMVELNQVWPGLKVESKPNRTRSTYHAELRYQGIVMTFSSAQEDGMPRPAGFRQDLMQAQLFRIGHNNQAESTDPIPEEIYVEIVYSRSGRELDFVKAVFVTTPEDDTMFLYRRDELGDIPDDSEDIQENNWFNEEE